MDSKYQALFDGCAQLGITLSERQAEQFRQYYELLVEWNSFMNLTAITELSEVIQKHFVDSLALVKGVSLAGDGEDSRASGVAGAASDGGGQISGAPGAASDGGGQICSVSGAALNGGGQPGRLLDVGTGAGFPGIPLKIVFPQLSVVLLDSLNKRVKFLNEVIEKLGLTDITAVHGRAEDIARQSEYRENFDIVVSRAVANLSSLSEYCLPYVKVGGLFVSYKSGNVEEEVKEAERAVSLLGGRQKKTVKFELPGSEIERSLVIIEKEKNTPKKYPRKAGMPGKEPLGQPTPGGQRSQRK